MGIVGEVLGHRLITSRELQFHWAVQGNIPPGSIPDSLTGTRDGKHWLTVREFISRLVGGPQGHSGTTFLGPQGFQPKALGHTSFLNGIGFHLALINP